LRNRNRERDARRFNDNDYENYIILGCGAYINVESTGEHGVISHEISIFKKERKNNEGEKVAMYTER
jgi:hypothetical protein